MRTLLRLVRCGIGGPAAGGKQYVSWIHDRDLVRTTYWLIDHPELSGAVNVAAPGPLPYRDFMRNLRNVASMPIGLRATRWMLALGTWVLRKEAELVLKSRRVFPSRLLASGVAFQYPAWTGAALDLVRRSGGRRRPAFDLAPFERSSSKR